MRSIGYLLLTLMALHIKAAPVSDCCIDKRVGGVEYVLVATNETQEYGCETNCIYAKKDYPASRFCFTQGDLPVECEGTLGIEEENDCFPQPGDKGCPPKENLRIVRQPFYDQTTRKDYNDCEKYCRDLHGHPPKECFAWTFNTENNQCYTYNSFPPCYNTRGYPGWYSGQATCV